MVRVAGQRRRPVPSSFLLCPLRMTRWSLFLPDPLPLTPLPGTLLLSSPPSRDVTHPHFNRLFRGLMSLRRRSHGPADVIPPVWRYHCRPERTLSKSVHCLRPVEGRFTPVPATNSRLWPLCHGTQTPVHPHYCVAAPRFGADLIGVRTCAGCYEGHASPARIIDRSHLGCRASPPTPDSSPPDAAQKCNCQLGPLQPRPSFSRLHKCNFQLEDLQTMSGTCPQVKVFTVSVL